jgi:hypothetical protein
MVVVVVMMKEVVEEASPPAHVCVREVTVLVLVVDVVMTVVGPRHLQLVFAQGR